MNFANLIGQVIDGKYRIERQLGKGGMGTVYLATHEGTERHVAIKVIVPQFMERAEFVERFRREARAAGRLRHPNVVDVTDFGIAEMSGAKIAYLVMEYLDGCTLGEILDEEKQLPLTWSLDILEQVSSAVHTAHEQGIIHRDLKPDNIWLEPNQRGGYTVKVLDFGIAKLEEQHGGENSASEEIHISGLPTSAAQFTETQAENAQTQTFHGGKGATFISDKNTAILDNESSTLIQTQTDFLEKSTAIIEPDKVDTEGGTAILPRKQTQIIEKDDGTKLLSPVVETDRNSKNNATAELTRVGAVLGTPLYMSPEQCRGEKLSPRSDIYSLGIIAYQMLGGKTPFEGDYRDVMESHKNTAPPILENKKVPARLKKVLFSALAKNPEERPPTAQAFASILRSYSEGVWTLMSKALVLYSENFVKFSLLAVIIYLPMYILFIAQTATALLTESETIGESPYLLGTITLLFTLSGFFCGTILTGIITWLVAQKMAVPMRPLKLRPAFTTIKKRLKTLFGTAAFSSIAAFFGLICFVVPGLLMWIFWGLVTPVVMMEGLKGRKAFARSYQLVRRNFWTMTGVIVVSVCFAVGVIIFASLFSKGLLGDLVKPSMPVILQNDNKQTDGSEPKEGIVFSSNGKMTVNTKPVENETPEQKKERRLKGTIRESVYGMIQIPLSTLLGSFFSVVLALLYIKTRLAGGESISDLLEQFEESDQPRSNWQRRIRERSAHSVRLTNKT